MDVRGWCVTWLTHMWCILHTGCMRATRWMRVCACVICDMTHLNVMHVTHWVYARYTLDACVCVCDRWHDSLICDTYYTLDVCVLHTGCMCVRGRYATRLTHMWYILRTGCMHTTTLMHVCARVINTVCSTHAYVTYEWCVCVWYTCIWHMSDTHPVCVITHMWCILHSGFTSLICMCVHTGFTSLICMCIWVVCMCVIHMHMTYEW